MLSTKSISGIERARNSRVLVLAASNLEIELLPELYRTLKSLRKVKRLDVVIYSRGGVVNGVRRIALILREYCEHLTFIVPHHCESSATLLCLAGDEIIAGSTAVFSPIDPLLQAQGSMGDEMPMSLSAQDLRLFQQAIQDWFNLSDEEARTQAVQQLGQSIFPTTLTSFYRAMKELEEIAMQLLSYSLPEHDAKFRTSIVNKLLYGYHSHSYAISGDELLEQGLKVCRDSHVEELAWSLAGQIRDRIGAGAYIKHEDGWCDAILATTDVQIGRRRYENVISPQWCELKKA